MCGRCNNNTENDGELVDGCGCCCGSGSGSGSSGQRRSPCLPYNDGYIIAAQVISVVAFLISWVWWVTFAIGLIALLLLQIIWCYRQNKDIFLLLASAAVSALAFLMCVLSGIYILVVWKDVAWCGVFVLESDDDYLDDDCEEGAWATVSFVSGVLWFAVTGCILYFVKSGRHAKWEEKLCNNDNDNDNNDSGEQGASTSTATAIATSMALEMGTVQHQQQEETASAATGAGGSVAAISTTAITTITPITTDDEALPRAAAVTTTITAADSSYVPPQIIISSKVDDV